MTAPANSLSGLPTEPYSQFEAVLTPSGRLECLEASFTVRREASETDDAFLERVRGLMRPGDRLTSPANGKLDHVRITRAATTASAWSELYDLLRRLLRLIPMIAGLRS